jgi:hypothetical protein
MFSVTLTISSGAESGGAIARPVSPVEAPVFPGKCANTEKPTPAFSVRAIASRRVIPPNLDFEPVEQNEGEPGVEENSFMLFRARCH